ncbi:unnamed protein product [Alopecurus aequalis]
MLKAHVGMKTTVTAPMSRPCGPSVRQRRSITQAEINHFWRRKKLEEEEHQLAHERMAARNKVKTLKQEEYMLFEQRIKGITDEEIEKTMEEEITVNSKEDARNIQIRIGIKDWWKKSSSAYLNEPAVTSMDGNNAPKDTTKYIPQNMHFRCCSRAPDQINVTALGIF